MLKYEKVSPPRPFQLFLLAGADRRANRRLQVGWFVGFRLRLLVEDVASLQVYPGSLVDAPSCLRTLTGFARIPRRRQSQPKMTGHSTPKMAESRVNVASTCGPLAFKVTRFLDLGTNGLQT